VIPAHVEDWHENHCFLTNWNNWSRRVSVKVWIELNKTTTDAHLVTIHSSQLICRLQHAFIVCGIKKCYSLKGQSCAPSHFCACAWKMWNRFYFALHTSYKLEQDQIQQLTYSIITLWEPTWLYAGKATEHKCIVSKWVSEWAKAIAIVIFLINSKRRILFALQLNIFPLPYAKYSCE